MKTIKNLLTVALFLFSIQLISADDLKIRTDGNTSVVIEINNETQDEKIRIYDRDANLLFFENIQKDNYIKTFVMNTLPSGQYFIEYENENKVKTAMVEKTEEGQLITTDFNKISFKPMFNQNGDYLSVGITNPKYESIDIIISDIEGSELLEINDLNELFVKKTFDTNRLPKGKYSLSVLTGSNSFTKVITIK